MIAFLIMESTQLQRELNPQTEYNFWMILSFTFSTTRINLFVCM